MESMLSMGPTPSSFLSITKKYKGYANDKKFLPLPNQSTQRKTYYKFRKYDDLRKSSFDQLWMQKVESRGEAGERILDDLNYF